MAIVSYFNVFIVFVIKYLVQLLYHRLICRDFLLVPLIFEAIAYQALTLMRKNLLHLFAAFVVVVVFERAQMASIALSIVVIMDCFVDYNSPLNSPPLSVDVVNLAILSSIDFNLLAKSSYDTFVSFEVLDAVAAFYVLFLSEKSFTKGIILYAVITGVPF